MRGAREVWKQTSIPVVYRPGKEPILVKIPYAEDNRDWLRGGKRSRPKWDAKYKCWIVPLAWFEDVIRRLLDRFGQVYVIEGYREQQKCAPACWNAVGAHCECSCMGANHGSQAGGGKWHEISETFAVRWGERKLAVRLLTEPV